MIPEVYPPEVHEKAWGKELWIRNGKDYCGKILIINPGSRFSYHFHLLKRETFYIAQGSLELIWIDTDKAWPNNKTVNQGDVIHLEPGVPHQLWNKSNEEARIFEVSTQHFESDSYRVIPGDSQK